jgi:RNA-splicing ligase RtcB
MMQAMQGHLRKDPVDRVESRHNFIDDTGMIRKGATPARTGERLVIPFNMRDGLALCQGKGNPDWNQSAPHGTGRLLSRSRAKAALDVDNFRAQMKEAGVYTTSVDASTLDESPDAYRDTRIILDAISGTVDVLELVRPVYNFKAGR